ncbi:hypothetical protein BGZ49_009108 [Haplosporangium sp. Z 27]|nr:hypothetical protein BGZ49_009108 [Haplosporangium sp. Z 27]
MDNKTNKPPNWRGESWLGFCDMAPNLHSVSLDNWNMTRQDLLSLLKACPNLKFISLEDIFLDQGSSIRPSIKASAASAEDSLEELDTTSAYQLEIHDDFQHLGIKTLRMCSRLFHVLDLMPNIEVLEFYRFDRQVNETELEQFCQSIKDNCKKLDQILASGFECSMLSTVLESLTRLVTYIGCSDEQTVFRILDHAKTLEVANLSDGLERTFLPLNFLESCPRLKSLTTGNSSTTISEVQESFKRGWACTNLRELRLAIFKLQPALIEMIMRDLGAVREQPNHHQNNVQIWMSSQLSQRQQIEAAIEALTPEQRQLSNELTGLIKEMRYLKRLNFGTGWYDIS